MQPNRKHKTRQNPYYFDTLESTEQLEQSGFTHEQAVAQTKVISKALSRVSDSYTTKQDLDLLEERLKYTIEVKLLETKNDLELKINQVESKITQVESRLIKVLFGSIASSTTITIAALGFLMTYLK